MDNKLELLKIVKKEIKNENEVEDMLANQFDDNYYGECELTFGRQKVEVESIWTDKDSHINIHVDSPYYEGDIWFSSISIKNQLRIIEMIESHIKEEEE